MNAAGIEWWTLARQAPPASVVAIATVASLVVIATAATWRVAVARLVAVLLIVVMLSGSDDVSRRSPAAARQPSSPRLVDLVLPRLARVGESVAVEAVARLDAVNASVPQPPLRVELVNERGEVLSDGRLQPVGGTPGAAHLTTWQASLPWQPTEAGIARLTARLFEGETRTVVEAATLPAVCGVDAAPTRVLIIDGTARWETRHLYQLLRATPQVEVTVALLETGARAAPPATREALAAFDAVVLGAFHPRDLPPGTAEALATLATADGLGVVWTLESRSDLAAFGASPLADLLPCRLTASSPSVPRTQGTRVARTPAAAGFRWLQPLLRAAERSQAEVYLPLRVEARRGTALAPLVFTSAPTPPRVDRPPAVLVDHSASGRVVALLMETWRWRAAGGGPDVDAFWRGVVASVAEPRRLQRMGAPLAEAAWAAERARRTRRAELLSEPWQVAREHRAWPQPVWNHPLLVAMVMIVLAAGWWLASHDTQANGRQAT